EWGVQFHDAPFVGVELLRSGEGVGCGLGGHGVLLGDWGGPRPRVRPGGGSRSAGDPRGNCFREVVRGTELAELAISDFFGPLFVVLADERLHVGVGIVGKSGVSVGYEELAVCGCEGVASPPVGHSSTTTPWAARWSVRCLA